MALTAAQIAELAAKDQTFKQLIARYGPPNSVISCNVPTAKPGDICLEGACVDGQMDVMYCTGNMLPGGFNTVKC
jgi:hypothetical protein